MGVPACTSSSFLEVHSTSVYAHTYIYIYIYVCVRVCACVCVGGKATHSTDYCSSSFDSLFSLSYLFVLSSPSHCASLFYSSPPIPSPPCHYFLLSYHVLSYFISSYLLFSSLLYSILPNSFPATSTLGVVDHGIFAGFTTAVIVAGKDGVRVAGAGGEKPWW